MSERLPMADLLAALRADGFVVGVDDHLRVARILSLDGSWTVDKLRCAVRAIVATDVASRARFDQVFARVFAGVADADPASGLALEGSDADATSLSAGTVPGAGAARRPHGPGLSPPAAGAVVAHRLRWTWLVVAVACATAAFLAWWYLSMAEAERQAARQRAAARRAQVIAHRSLQNQPNDASEATGRIGKPPSRQGTTKVSLEQADRHSDQVQLPVASDPKAGNQGRATGSDLNQQTGNSSGTWTSPQSPDAGPAGTGNSDASRDAGAGPTDGSTSASSASTGPPDSSEAASGNLDANSGDGRVNSSVQAVDLTGDRSDGNPASEWKLIPDRAPADAGSESQLVRDWRPIVSWALLAGGGAALISVLFFGHTVRRRRGAFVPGPWRYRRRVPDAGLQPLFSQRDIEDGAAALTWRQRAESGHILDIDGTVTATVAAGGFPTPSYQAPPASPTYAVLVDMSARSAPFLPLYDELFSRLANHGVRIRRFEYDGSPAVSRPVGSERELTLAELAEERDAIIVVGDGALARDPFEHATAPWVPVLEHFPQRLWLNPLPPSRWSESAHEIARTTPMVHGASAVLGALQPGADLPESSAHTYPAVIELAPDSELAMTALAAYLGPAAMRLLQLCAAAGEPSPAMARFLAVRLGARLAAQPGENAYLRLVGLPVFATRRFPDGVRERLLARLRTDEPDAESAVHDLMLEVLTESEPASGSVAHLHWRLDRLVVDANRGAQRAARGLNSRGNRRATRGAERELSALSLTPIFNDARRERVALGLRDRIARILWAFTLVGVVALLIGAVLGYPALTASDREKTAEKRSFARDWGRAWRKVEVCFYGTDVALPDPEDALALQLATTPQSRLDWDRCTDGLGALREYTLFVVSDAAGDADEGRWRQLNNLLERAENGARGMTPRAAYRSLGSSFAALEVAYGQLLADLELAPARPTRAEELAVDLGGDLGKPVHTSDGEAVELVTIERQGATLVLRTRTRASARDASPQAESPAESPADSPAELDRDSAAPAVAYGIGADDIEWYAQSGRTVRAMAGAAWGLFVDGTGAIRAGSLGADGRRLTGNSRLVASSFASAPFRKSKKKRRKAQAPVRRELLPRYAIGSAGARLAVIENRSRPGSYVLARTDVAGRWRELGERLVDVWREDWATGRLLGLQAENDRLRWLFVSDSSPEDILREGQRGASVGAGKDRSDAGPVRSGCLGCGGFFSVHERAAYWITPGKSSDGSTFTTMPLPDNERVTSTCSGNSMFALLKVSDDAEEAYWCTTDSCSAIGRVPARTVNDTAIGVFPDVGPVLAYADLGLLLVWRQTAPGQPLTRVPVARVPEGLTVAAVQVWQGELIVALRDETRIWLTGAPWPGWREPLQRPSNPKTSAYRAFLDTLGRADADIGAMRASFSAMADDNPYRCEAEPLFERARTERLKAHLGASYQDLFKVSVAEERGPDGVVTCVELEELRAKIASEFPDVLDTLADIPCECPSARQCSRLKDPPACCREYKSNPKEPKAEPNADAPNANQEEAFSDGDDNVPVKGIRQKKLNTRNVGDSGRDKRVKKPRQKANTKRTKTRTEQKKAESPTLREFDKQAPSEPELDQNNAEDSPRQSKP